MTRLDLKVAIVRSGLRQYEVARTIGVSENSLSKFICGHGTLRSEHLEKLHALLGVEDAGHKSVCVAEDGGDT